MGFCAIHRIKLLLHSTPVRASIKQALCQRHHHGCSFFSQAKNWFAVKYLNRLRNYEFMNSLPNYPLHSHGVIDAPKVLADIVESTIGAVFVDSNSSVDTTWEVAKVLLEPMITPEMLQTNPVTKLYEICQKNRLEIRFVDQWSQEGAYEVFVGKLRGRGEYQAKKEIAFNRAAENALCIYNNITRSGLTANGR